MSTAFFETSTAKYVEKSPPSAPGKKLCAPHSIAAATLKGCDLAVGELYAWKEYRAAWICRAGKSRIVSGNYPLPEPLRPRDGDMPVPGRSAVPRLVQKIDSGGGWGDSRATKMGGGVPIQRFQSTILPTIAGLILRTSQPGGTPKLVR